MHKYNDFYTELQGTVPHDSSGKPPAKKNRGLLSQIYENKEYLNRTILERAFNIKEKICL